MGRAEGDEMKEYIISAEDVKALEEEFNIIISFDKDDELIRCEHCKYNHGRGGVYCELLPQMFGRAEWETYCSLAEPKEEE